MPTPDFVHLHVHSHYSLLDGMSQIPALMQRTKDLGMKAVALTDHGAMYGIIDFYETALKYDIHPIIGVEAYVAARTRFDKDHKLDAKSHHLVLLAETYEGYKNLVKLTSEAHINGFYYKPRIDKELLRAHKDGLIATSACIQGEISRKLQESYDAGRKALEEYLEIFGPDHFFLELQYRPEVPENAQVTRDLVKLSKEFGVGLICTNDSHYLDREDAEAQDVLVCIASGKTVNDPNRLIMTESDLHFSSPEEMAELFKEYPEALENTVRIAERCQVKIPLGVNIMPVFPIPEEAKEEGLNDRTYLRRLCEEGLEKRYGIKYKPDTKRAEGTMLQSPMNDPAIPLEQRVKDRLEYELSVIEKMGFESYFLIVSDFIIWAREHNIMIGPGRGSAAGSLVGYLTTITNIDPLEHNLIFERFLNPERIGMPDIDTDIEDARRDEVIAYVRERYGTDHVAQIITFGTMASRAAIRDVGRALAISYGECDYIAKLIPSGPGGMSLKEARENIEELKVMYQQSPQIKQLVNIASRLEGVARHTSIHAAGVVVTRDPLTDSLPIQRAVKDANAIVTQYAMNQVEHIGLLKMDFLGLANLNILQQAMRVIRKTRKVEVDIDHLPLDDKESYELLARAETTGVFQLESAGMKRYLKDLKPTQFEDIVAMVALYRPGPMDSIPNFIEAKHGRKKVTYLHPILEPILQNSYGVIVTQDQVLEVARKFAGFTYGQADVLRKAVGKKIKALLDEQRDKFINGAVKDVGIDKATAVKVWDFVEPFARYGFNRAHAVCYAMIAYQTAYLKAHYPVEFMSSLLTSDIDDLDRVRIEIAECRDMGIEVLQPDVNESFVEFGAIYYPEEVRNQHQRDSYIRFGLGAIKNVGIHPAEGIVEERKKNGPFKDFGDFLSRSAAFLNKKVLENLAMSGALDSMVERNQVLENMDLVLAFTSRIMKERNSPQIGLFSAIDEGDETRGGSHISLELFKATPAPPRQRLEWERELLGIYLSDHPISPYVPNLPTDRHPICSLAEQADGASVRICGVIMSSRKILTKKNVPMAFLLLEDDTGSSEAVVFPKVWAQCADLIQEGTAVCIDGKIGRREGFGDSSSVEIKVLADSVSRIAEGEGRFPCQDRLTLQIPDNGDRKLLMNIKQCLETHPGQVPVTLLLPALDGSQEMNVTQRVTLNGTLYGTLVGLVGKEAIQ